MVITFIRHSKTVRDLSHSNLLWVLSDEGEQLARELSNETNIKHLPILFTSDQTKALATTLILAKDNYIPIRVVPELTEATSITKGPIADYPAETHHWYTTPGSRINDGETTQEAFERFSHTIDAIIAQYNQYESIGIVSHCNVLSLYTAQFSGRSPLDIHNTMKMPDSAILDWNTKTLLKDFYHD